ncbi:MAG: hypothetical protein ACXVP2_06740 [Tumebacillaceae bacterium]
MKWTFIVGERRCTIDVSKQVSQEPDQSIHIESSDPPAIDRLNTIDKQALLQLIDCMPLIGI